MAKMKGEPERGTHCARCGKICTMEDKVLITYRKYYRDKDFHPNISSNHRMKTINSMNFCNKCMIRVSEVMKAVIAERDVVR